MERISKENYYLDIAETVLDLRFYREGVQPLADQADDVLVLYELTNFAADKNLYKLNKS